MKSFCESFINIESFKNNNRTPMFENLLKVLRNEKPTRPTLFEFIISNNTLIDLLTENITYDKQDPLFEYKRIIDTYRIAGYDFTPIKGKSFVFKTKRHQEAGKSTLSLNEGYIITDRKSFDNYEWMEPEDADYSWLEKLADYLPEGMKLLVPGPDGIFETVLSLVGYDNLCYMLVDEPELVQEIFDAIGSRYLRYYQICSQFDSVGAMMQDDDWGFKTQTFLSLNDMRKYVIPWHIKIAEAVHCAGKPIVLHSCGKIESLIDEVIFKIKHNGWHSFEDNILPAETAYEKYQGKIAILGGIDIDFLCQSTPEQIYQRACSMLERTKERGGYALGSGNSIPEYIPVQNYLAMIAAAVMNENS